MITTHNLGYPRIGVRRELKSACERYWSGRATLDELNAVGTSLRAAHWQAQRDAGIDLIPCNDFSFYDHLQDRIDQLEQELARTRRPPSDPQSEFTMPQLDECW